MDAWIYQQLFAFGGEVTAFFIRYFINTDDPSTKRQSALWLWSLTAAGSWLVESDHQLVETATANGGQSVTPLKVSPYLAAHCRRLCGCASPSVERLRAEHWVCSKSAWTSLIGLMKREQMYPSINLSFDTSVHFRLTFQLCFYKKKIFRSSIWILFRWQHFWTLMVPHCSETH